MQADGTLLWFFPAVADEVSWRGALSPRGDLAVLASTRGGSDPEIVVAFRVRAGLTEDSLRGTYFFNGLWAALDDTHIGLVGVGALDIDDPERPLEWSTDEFNVDGAVDTRAHARWGRFSVSDDGGVTHTLVPPFGTGEARGGAYAGGQLVLLGASPLAGHPPELNAFVRREAPPVLCAAADLRGPPRRRRPAAPRRQQPVPIDGWHAHGGRRRRREPALRRERESSRRQRASGTTSRGPMASTASSR